MIMKLYLISLGLGLAVGVLYSLFSVRSPAPPIAALIGLFGMLAGEQIIPMAKKWFWKPDEFAAQYDAGDQHHEDSGDQL